MHDNNAPENATPFAVPEPDWAAWKDTLRAPLWKAMALLLNIEPKHILVMEGGTLSLSRQIDHMPAFFEALDKAITALEIGHLRSYSEKHPDTETAEVDLDLAEFAQWAEAKGYSIPLGFPQRGTKATMPIFGWPWGNYDNRHLRVMAEAIQEFWQGYDPKSGEAAPKKIIVVAWLMERGITEHIAKAMDTIMRADNIKPGRQAKKTKQ